MLDNEIEQYEERERLNHSFNSHIYNSLDLSSIYKSKFSEHYHYICKDCNTIPKIQFIKKNKIKYKCECELSPKEFLIKDIYNYLFYSEEKNLDTPILKCILHPNEKYLYYCEECKKNICYKCIENCIEHERKIESIFLDKKTIDACKYISKKINERKDTTIEDNINSSVLEEDDATVIKLLNENNHLISKMKKKNNTKIDFNEKDIINIINENNNEEINEEESSLNLFSIIINDYQNYPNYNHIETISNIEKYVSYFFGDCNKIYLKYEFNKEDIKYNSFELFGVIFINNNKENLFLFINEKIHELNRYINISDIFDNYINIKYPIQLEVQLINHNNNIINNISFMFYGINNLLPSSDFSEFNTINITKMSYFKVEHGKY